MTVRTRALFPPTTVAAGFVVLYTAPAGFVGLLKDLRVFSATPAPGNTLTLYHNVVGPGNTIDVLAIGNAAGVRFTPWFLVINSGDSLVAVGPGLGCVVSGYGAQLQL